MTYCTNCHEYKGIMTCRATIEHCSFCNEDEECGTEFCIFCEDWCPGCGAEIQ